MYAFGRADKSFPVPPRLAAEPVGHLASFGRSEHKDAVNGSGSWRPCNRLDERPFLFTEDEEAAVALDLCRE